MHRRSRQSQTEDRPDQHGAQHTIMIESPPVLYIASLGIL